MDCVKKQIKVYTISVVVVEFLLRTRIYFPIVYQRVYVSLPPPHTLSRGSISVIGKWCAAAFSYHLLSSSCVYRWCSYCYCSYSSIQPFKLMKRVVEIVSLSSVSPAARRSVSISVRLSKGAQTGGHLLSSRACREKRGAIDIRKTNKKKGGKVPRPWQIESPSGTAATIALKRRKKRV